MSGLNPYQQQYLANRAIKIAQMKAEIEQKNNELRYMYTNKLYNDFSQSNNKQLKRCAAGASPNTMPLIYNWLNNYGTKL